VTEQATKLSMRVSLFAYN